MPDKVKKVVGLGLVIGASFFGGPAAAALAQLVGASLIASGSKPKPTSSTTNGTELQLSGDPVDVRSVCYGEAWTAGTLRYRNTTGTDNKDLYMVVVLAGHEIDSVQAVEADRQTLTLDGSGNVTSPSKWAGLMNVRFYTGSDSQTADSTLDSTFTNWTTDHRLRGLAYAVIKLTFNEESLNSPPAFRFKVRGKKVYDPRLDSTNGGSGSHRLATPSTWAWSRNPVLCANDFLRGVKVNSINIAGMGLASTRFDWANVIAEANVCEENVALAAGGNEDRYTCDGFIDPRQPMGEILRHFEMAIAGDIIPSDGKWRFFCGAYRTPTLSLTDQHFIGPIRYNVHKGELERYDTAEGRYAALAESGTVVNYSPVRLSTATTGSERLLSIDFQLVADTADSGYDGGARPQRLAKLLLEKDAAGKRIQCRTNLYGLRCVPGETVQITHAAFGLTTQAMRVLEVQLVTIDVDGKQGLAVDLTLEAGPSSLYSWSAEESALSPAPSIPQAGPGRGIIEGLLISDPYFSRRGELWDGSGESDSYYWRKSGDPSSTGAGVSIDLTGGSNDDVGALVLSTNGSTIDWSRALAVGKATAQTIIRGEQVAFKIRLRRTTSVPTGDLNKVFYVDIGRGDGDGFVGEYDSAPGFRLLHADLAALTLNQWYEYEWVSRLGEVGTADLHPEYNRCAVEIALTSGDAMTIEVDSITPHRIGTAKQIGLILQPKTAAETSAGATPVDYSKAPTPIRDISRYVSDNTGAVDVTAELQAACAVSKARLIIPEGSYKITGAIPVGTGHVIEGAGRTRTNILNYGGSTVDAFVTEAGVRGAVIRDLTITGQTGSRDGIRFTADFGHVQLENLGIVVPGRGVNAQAGNGIDIYMKDVRAYGTTACFDFDASSGTAINTLNAIGCYAAGSDGATDPTVGWNFANVSAAQLIGCSADGSVDGYILGGRVKLSGCTAEANTSSGFSVLGSGQIVFIECFTESQVLPFYLNSAADVIMIAIRSSNTPTGASLTMTSSATGKNILIAHALDSTLSLNASATLTQMDVESITFGGDTKLYRSAADQLKTDDKLITAAGLGVGNYVTNTNTPSGATAKAIQVFDASGASIGYIPVYGSTW